MYVYTPVSNIEIVLTAWSFDCLSISHRFFFVYRYRIVFLVYRDRIDCFFVVYRYRIDCLVLLFIGICTDCFLVYRYRIELDSRLIPDK